MIIGFWLMLNLNLTEHWWNPTTTHLVALQSFFLSFKGPLGILLKTFASNTAYCFLISAIALSPKESTWSSYFSYSTGTVWSKTKAVSRKHRNKSHCYIYKIQVNESKDKETLHYLCRTMSRSSPNSPE